MIKSWLIYINKWDKEKVYTFYMEDALLVSITQALSMSMRLLLQQHSDDLAVPESGGTDAKNGHADSSLRQKFENVQ